MVKLKIVLTFTAFLCTAEVQKAQAGNVLSARDQEKLNFPENQDIITSNKPHLEHNEQIKRALRTTFGYMMKSKGYKHASDANIISSSSSDSQSEDSSDYSSNMIYLRKLRGDLMKLASLIKTEACFRKSYLSKQRGLYSSKKQKLIPVYDICLPQPSAYIHTIPTLASSTLPPPLRVPSFMEYRSQQPTLFHLRNN